MKFGMKSYYRLIVILLAFCLCTNTGFGQEEQLVEKKLEIKRVVLDRKDQLLNVFVSVPGEVTFNSETARFYERFDGQRCDLNFYDFDKTSEIKGAAVDTFSILFLMDCSASMRADNRIQNSKEAIRRTMEEINLPPGSQIYFSIFNDTISRNQILTKDNVEEILEPVIIPPKGFGKYTDLYRALIWKVRELEQMPGKKVFILLSDGENDTKVNPYYKTNRRFQPEEVDAEFKRVDEAVDFLMFPIGLGGETDSVFLKNLPTITKDTSDGYVYSENATELLDIFLDVLSTYSSDYMVQLTPTCTDYKGEVRFNYVEATPFGTTNFGTKISSFFYWLKLILLGLFIVGFLLLGLMYLVPFLKSKEFKRRYVIPFEPEPNKIKRDPITQDAFEEGDLVVIKCRQVTSLSTWQALGHCPNYPSCMEFNDPCPGSGGEDIQGSFFSQQGIFRILNWLWYGAVGGFVGWLFYALSRYKDFQWLNDLTEDILTGKSMFAKLNAMDGGPALINNHAAFVDNFLYGLFTGTFVILALTFAEEMGQTRKFSIKRMLVRGLLGLLVSFIIFLGGALLNFLVIQNVLITELITWSAFGLAFGAILSVDSSIDIKRALLGSIIAVIVAFGVYYGIYSLIQSNDGLQRLLSNLALGAVLGALVVTIIANLEDFELVYLSPSEYSGMVKPISKWLKKGMEIFIGTSSKCYVFIKWDDEFAQDKHAKLIYYGGVVYVIPMYETLVNGVIVPENQKTPLQNGDVLQLGRYSNTKMQYKEKRSPVK
jgi:hypothetical protein